MTATSNRLRRTTTQRRTWAAIVAPLIGAAALAACGPDGGVMGADGGVLIGSDASLSQPDAGASADVGAPPAGSDGGARPLPANATCTVAAQCASGFCVDGVCCDAACDGSCETCALTGKVGTCSPITDASDDTCGGDLTCDGSGRCRKLLGKACTASNECASGSCVDGVCCGSAACGDCQSCAMPGSEGSCAPVPRFTDDANSGCVDGRTCDGLGTCRSKNGTGCRGDAECTSLHCADGVCCNEACDGICYSCNQTGSAGTCKPLDGAEDATRDATCGDAWICSAPAGATPGCKLRDGQPCFSHADCLNGSCLTSYRDGDGDGSGSAKVTRCERAPAPGYALAGGDCCDSDANTHPGATTASTIANACGSYDRNCDGKVERSDGSNATCGCIPGVGESGAPVLCTYCK